MPTYTADASVFLNAFNPSQAGHENSRRALQWLQEEAAPIVAPALLLPETAAAIARGAGDPALTGRFARAVARLPHLILVPLDLKLARQAADLAVNLYSRGADAVYVAVAIRFGSVLLTLDKEQRERAATQVTVSTPERLLESARGLSVKSDPETHEQAPSPR